LIIGLNEKSSLRDSLGVKRDIMRRTKEVALRDNTIIYCKSDDGVDLSNTLFDSLIEKAIEHNKTSKSAFYESGKNSTRVILIEKWECTKEPCKSSSF